MAQGVLRHDLQADIPQIRGQGQRTVGGRQAPVQVTQLPQRGGQRARNLALPAGIPQARGQGFGWPQDVEEPLVVAEGHQRIAQGYAEINGLRGQVGARRKMLEGAQGLLKGHARLPEARAPGRLCARLPAVPHRLLPEFASHSMVGEQVDHFLAHPVPRAGLEAIDQAGMQPPPLLLEEALIGHLVREGVLEGIDVLGDAPGLVEELRLCKWARRSAGAARAAPPWLPTAARGPPGPGLPPCAAGVAPPGAGARCAPRARPARSPARGQAPGPRAPAGAGQLFQKQRIPLRPREDLRHQGRHLLGGGPHDAHQGPTLLRGEGCDSKLRGIRLAHPGRVVPGAVGRDQEERDPGEVLHQGGQVGFDVGSIQCRLSTTRRSGCC